MNDVFYNMRDLRERTLYEEASVARCTQLNMFEPSPEEKIFLELEILKTAILSELENSKSYIRNELRGRVAAQADNFGRFSGSQFTAVLGGRPRGISVPAKFENLKARIKIHNGSTLGNDKVEISLTI